jgi:glycosyltransferase involved in cell wall biosynthesis
MTDPSSQAGARLRLAFVCAGDPLDLRTWSGTPAHMLQALRPHFDIVDVVTRPFPGWFLLLRRAVRRLTGGSIDIMWSKFWTSRVSAKTVTALKNSDCDYVFAVAVTPIAAYVVSVKPTIFLSDATQELMSGYNPHHMRLAPWLKRSAASLESKSIAGAEVCLFPSNWATKSAIADHGGRPGQVIAAPWGANLIADSITKPETRSPTDWRLLFVGTHWYGKGGDIALAAVAKMRREGRNVQIDIVGSEPGTPHPKIEGVTFHGFLNKNLEADRARLNDLFRAADVFFLPTRFDALGIVFAEAASYALPAVSYDTGGVSAMVVDQETGLLLEEGSSADAFADALIGLLEDRERYLKMSHAALERSRSTLNWAAWGERVAGELAARHGSSRNPANDGA